MVSIKELFDDTLVQNNDEETQSIASDDDKKLTISFAERRRIIRSMDLNDFLNIPFAREHLFEQYEGDIEKYIEPQIYSLWKNIRDLCNNTDFGYQLNNDYVKNHLYNYFILLVRHHLALEFDISVFEYDKKMMNNVVNYELNRRNKLKKKRNQDMQKKLADTNETTKTWNNITEDQEESDSDEETITQLSMSEIMKQQKLESEEEKKREQQRLRIKQEEMEAERLRRAFGSKYGSKKYNKQDDDNMNDKPRNNPFKDVARKRNNKLFTFGDHGDGNKSGVGNMFKK